MIIYLSTYVNVNIHLQNRPHKQTQAKVGAISKKYPADYCNLTELFEFTFESISVSCNFDSNTSEIQKILSNCSSQQGTFLKLRQGQPMSA